MYAAMQGYCEGYRHVVLNRGGHGPVATCTKSGNENQGTLENILVNVVKREVRWAKKNFPRYTCI